MKDVFLTGEINNWLQCTLWLFLKFFVTGVSWSALFSKNRLFKNNDWLSRFIFKASLSLLIGIVFHLLVVLVLAEIGVYFFLNELILTLLIIVTGVAITFLVNGHKLKLHLRDNLPGILFFLISVTAIMFLPETSEWLVGGIDPGIYQNQGIYVEKTGTFYPEPEVFYRNLTEEELQLFTRGKGKYIECMPGIPLSVKSRSIQNYFFRLTPSMTASIARSGGLRGAMRVNYFAGFFAVVIFMGLLVVGGADRSFQLFSLILLLIQPVFLYHLHIPTSEMLQFALILGMGLLLVLRKSGVFILIMIGLTFFLLVVNRLSFMPFATILICCTACLDSNRDNRHRVWIEHISMILGLIAGICFDYLVCGITIERLKNPLQIMIVVAIISIIMALLIDTVSVRIYVRKIISNISTSIARLILILFLVFIAVLWLWGKNIGLKEGYDTIHSIVPYFGKGIFITSIAGMYVLFWRKKENLMTIKLMIVFMIVVTLIILNKSFVHGTYPWAVRRFLAYTVPGCTLLSGYFLSRIWQIKFIPKRGGRILALLIMVILSGCTAKKSWHAWKNVEYQGVSVVLADIAKEIGDSDIVIIDTPTWGTPLKFTYGKNIVNGKHLWRRKSKEGMICALKVLERMRGVDRKIRFLTTTQTVAMDIYPVKLHNIKLDYKTEEIILDEINHSRRSDDFELRKKRNVFRLFTWDGIVFKP